MLKDCTRDCVYNEQDVEVSVKESYDILIISIVKSCSSGRK